VAFDVGKATRFLQREYLDSSPPRIRPLDVSEVLTETQRVKNLAAGRVVALKANPTTWPQWLTTTIFEQHTSSLERLQTWLDFMQAELDQAVGDGATGGKVVGDRVEVGNAADLRLWKNVTGPLINGECWGPPRCTEALVAAQGGLAKITPIAIEPYILLNALDVQGGEATREWDNFKRDIVDRAKAGAGRLGDMAWAVAAGFAVYLITRD